MVLVGIPTDQKTRIYPNDSNESGGTVDMGVDTRCGTLDMTYRGTTCNSVGIDA